MIALAAAPAATAAPGDIERLTLDTGGGNPADTIVLGSLSLTDDGGLVAFESVAEDLVAGDADNGTFDVFLRDVGADTTAFGNLDSGGAKANGVFSGNPALSGDGSTLVFYSNGTNLDAGDGGPTQDVFRRDFAGPTTARVSLDSGGSDPNDPSAYPDLSEDGSDVVFASLASDLFPFAGDGPGTSDIVIRDGFVNRLVSAVDGTDDTFGDGSSFNPAISEDGDTVAFESEATNLANGGGDTNGVTDVLVREVPLETTVRVSLTDSDDQSDGFSGNPDISANGQQVVFASSAVLAPGGSSSGRGTYVRDRGPDTTERVDVSWTTAQDDNNEIQLDEPTISDDGRYVAFATDASTMVPNDTNGTTDVFVRDTLEGRTIRVSIRADGSQTNRRSLTGTISGDGTAVAYATEDRGMVPGMGAEPYNPFYEAFLVELDWSRPQTSITTPAPVETTSSQVSTAFASSKLASTFQCRIDGGAFSQCSSPFTTPPLPPGAHSIEVRAVDRFGNDDDTVANTSFVITAPPTGGGSQPGQVPPPEYRQTFNLEPVSGQVFVILPDGRRVRIQDLTSIPNGSIVDVRRGKVRLLVEEKDGTVSSTVWSQGMFKIVQLASGITECRLVGPLVEGRIAGAAAASPRAHAAAKRRRLWGNGTGKFRTKGRFGSATVRGTKWLTEDRRTGTLFLVRRGSVKVRDFVRKKTVILKKGDRYFARKRKPR